MLLLNEIQFNRQLHKLREELKQIQSLYQNNQLGLTQENVFELLINHLDNQLDLIATIYKRQA